MKYFYRLPKILQTILGCTVIKSSLRNTNVYLTFDDGPHPDSTPEILRILSEYKGKASFFCTGKNAEEFPELLRMIKEAGHNIGVHGYNHLNGCKTGTEAYLKDIEKASDMINSDLFRPPYGRLSFRQYLKLKNTFRIILWDILFKDYNTQFNHAEAFRKSKRFLKPGAIIVMHDKPPNINNTKVLLTLVLEYLRKNRLNPTKII